MRTILISLLGAVVFAAPSFAQVQMPEPSQQQQVYVQYLKANILKNLPAMKLADLSDCAIASIMAEQASAESAKTLALKPSEVWAEAARRRADPRIASQAELNTMPQLQPTFQHVSSGGQLTPLMRKNLITISEACGAIFINAMQGGR